MSELPNNVEYEMDAAREERHVIRMRGASRWRTWLLRLALGRRQFDYMVRSLKADPRTPGAKLVDIVVRQDAKERRIEADWVKTIARITYHVEPRQL